MAHGTTQSAIRHKSAAAAPAGGTESGAAGDATGLTVKSASNPECGAFGRRFANLEKIARVQKVPVKALFELGKE